MGLESFYGKESHPLLWAGSPERSAEITLTGTTNSLNYCVIFIIYTQFTNAAAGRGLETCAGHHSGIIYPAAISFKPGVYVLHLLTGQE